MNRGDWIAPEKPSGKSCCATRETLGKLSPRDLRRTGTKLCRKSGEISSRFSCCWDTLRCRPPSGTLEQNLSSAVNDAGAHLNRESIPPQSPKGNCKGLGTVYGPSDSSISLGSTLHVMLVPI